MRTWLWVSLVVLAFFLVWAMWSRLEPSRENEGPDTLTPHLVQLFGEPDHAVGRLTHGPAYTLKRLSAGAVASFAGNEQLLLEVELERAARTDRSAEDLHSLGLLRTFGGRFDEAIDALLTARLEAPEDSRVASDLASAYLGGATKVGGNPLYVLLAAEAATQALALDPRLPEGRFNLALALDQLSLRGRAQQAWESYLELDSSSEWARIARQRLEELTRPPMIETWESFAESLENPKAPSLDEDSREQLSRFPSLAREHVEEHLLPRWATASTEGRLGEAEALLVLAEEIGAELAAAGDRMVLAEVRAIRRTTTVGDGELLADLAEAHRSLASGLALSKQHASQEADPLLADAEHELRRAGSPLADLAAFRRSVGLRSQDRLASRKVLQGILGRLGQGPYPTLLGRVEWMLGLTFADEGDYATALTWYESAADRFSGVQDDIGLGGIQALIVEAYRKLGQPASAWRARLAGLGVLSRIGNASGLVRTLEEAVTALAQEDRVDLGLLFQDELLTQAAAWEGSATAVPTALWKRATLLARAGDFSAALSDLSEAERLIEAVPDETARGWVRAEIEMVRGELLVEQAPQEAYRLLDRVIEHSEQVGHATRLPGLLHHRARAALGLGDWSAAASDLERALQMAEERRISPTSEALRISFFETFQPSYDAMVSFQATEVRDFETAMLYADLSRSRALLDRVASRSVTPGELSLESLFSPRESSGDLFVERLQTMLPDSVALVEFATLPDRTLVWIVSKRSFEMVELPLPAVILERQVKLLRSTLEQGASLPKIKQSTSSLFEKLIRPILPAIQGVDRLLLVPDRYLYGFPFGALFDAESERFWIEDYELILAPSAVHLLVNGTQESRTAQRRTALVVADPTFDREQFPQLAPLPGADLEGRSIAKLYPQADLLIGTKATVENVLATVARHSVLHLGAHTVVDEADPSESRLVLTAGSGTMGDGSLGLKELRSVDLREVEVAFLSACTTASPFPGHDREGLAGLVRGFLAAGVPTVVGTLWRVEDRAASAIAIEFHRSLAAGADPATALRNAQLASLRSDDEGGSSPAAWAAFQAYSTQPRAPAVID